LSAPGHKTLAVATPDPGAPSRDVAIWRDTVPAVDAGDDAACWLTAVLNRPARLVHQADPTTRAVRPAYARPGDCVSFADGFPLLLASTASLADLNRRLGSPVGMTRFRPNLVFEGTMKWEEDCWLRIGIGTAVLRVAKPCDRCVVTTIDQDSAQRPDPVEPIRTLGTFRRDRRGGVMFGQNAVPERCGVLRVGDAVEVLEIGPANVMFEERRAGSASF
jgi:uncharacterized protein YcbX